MNKESFWIFTSLGLGDEIVQNALFRHYADKHKEKIVILPAWDHNIAALQWMLSDVPNIFFYPIETEQQLFTCRDSLHFGTYIGLGWYEHDSSFNPVLWDSEFYRQAGLDPELKWKGFKLPEFQIGDPNSWASIVRHHDPERGFIISDIFFTEPQLEEITELNKSISFARSCICMATAKEIHCIDSSMLNLADLMETPYCKRFVFHRYSRRGLPPSLRKPWEIID